MMSVRNESDIVGQVIKHLISQGIQLVILEGGSSDGSFEVCSEFVGHGVLSLESESSTKFQWHLILKRLYEMALRHQPDWVLLNGADEFLEAPSHGQTLEAAIRSEADKGYDLIQFNNFEFWPTKDDDPAEGDVTN